MLLTRIPITYIENDIIQFIGYIKNNNTVKEDVKKYNELVRR